MQDVVDKDVAIDAKRSFAIWALKCALSGGECVRACIARPIGCGALLELGHGEEVVIGPAQVRRRDERQATNGTVHRKFTDDAAAPRALKPARPRLLVTVYFFLGGGQLCEERRKKNGAP